MRCYEQEAFSIKAPSNGEGIPSLLRLAHPALRTPLPRRGRWRKSPTGRGRGGIAGILKARTSLLPLCLLRCVGRRSVLKGDRTFQIHPCSLPRRPVNLKRLRRLAHHRNHRLNRRTAWLVALQLANGNRHIGGQVEQLLSLGLELLQVFGLGGGALLLEEIHNARD